MSSRDNDLRDHRRLSAIGLGNAHRPQPGPLCDPRTAPQRPSPLWANGLVALGLFVIPLVLWVML